MSVIGFGFSKLDCVRQKATSKGSIEIKHNISITNVEKTTLNVGGNKNDVLKIDFSFDVLYGNSLGKISIAGDIVYSDTKEIVAESEKKYKADKSLNPTIAPEINKFIYNKGIVKALEIADSLNLPAPIPVMPKGMFSQQAAPAVKKVSTKKK